MREVLIRPRAYADMENIWLYTHDHWGAEQAARYLHRLDETIQALASEPKRGTSMESLRPGYYSIRVGRHVVFYKFSDQTVGIERVLHDQMDMGRHL